MSGVDGYRVVMRSQNLIFTQQLYEKAFNLCLMMTYTASTRWLRIFQLYAQPRTGSRLRPSSHAVLGPSGDTVLFCQRPSYNCLCYRSSSARSIESAGIVGTAEKSFLAADTTDQEESVIPSLDEFDAEIDIYKVRKLIQFYSFKSKGLS